MRAAASAAASGIAVGRAIVWASDPAPNALSGPTEEEHARLARAIRRATRGVEELVRLLPRSESELFEPEVAILDELGPAMLAEVDAGARPEDAVNHATSGPSTDLLVDARARLLDGLAQDPRTVEALLEGRAGDLVLVTEKLTPSVVASLPGRVVGIVAASSGGVDDLGRGQNSHAAILARGRVIPLVFVDPQIILQIADDDLVVLDATVEPAVVWIAPGDEIVADARTRREEWARARVDEEIQVSEKPLHLGVEVHVNVGSLHEHVPTSAEGVGLVRTELIFADSARAPSEMDQFRALRAVAAKAGRVPVVVRLFDAGGDKPLSWLPAPDESPGLRGIELLFMHPALLDTQLRAIERAAETDDVRVLLPLVRSAGDVDRVRALCRRKLAIGAMIETPQAVERSEEIIAASDFVSIGTNDLFAAVTGQEEVSFALSPDTRVLRMIARVVAAARRSARKVTVCGEMAGEPHSARILAGLGVDVLSVAPGRFAKVKLSFRDVTIEDCRGVASEALK